MIQHFANFWKFGLRSRFEVRNRFWAQPSAKSSWFNNRPIFESLICDRDLRSQMDSEPNLNNVNFFFTERLQGPKFRFWSRGRMKILRTPSTIYTFWSFTGLWLERFSTRITFCEAFQTFFHAWFWSFIFWK